MKLCWSALFVNNKLILLYNEIEGRMDTEIQILVERAGEYISLSLVLGIS